MKSESEIIERLNNQRDEIAKYKTARAKHEDSGNYEIITAYNSLIDKALSRLVELEWVLDYDK